MICPEHPKHIRNIIHLSNGNCGYDYWESWAYEQTTGYILNQKYSTNKPIPGNPCRLVFIAAEISEDGEEIWIEELAEIAELCQ